MADQNLRDVTVPTSKAQQSFLTSCPVFTEVSFLPFPVTFAQDNPSELLKKSNVKLLSHIARLLFVHRVCLSLNDGYPEKW